jgi:P-type Ca2+ transporter type 2C
VNPVQGLSAAAAHERLQADGHNELPSARPRSAWRIAVDVLREPMFLLLLAAAAAYIALGDVTEALVLLASVIVIIGITFAQERKTERTLEALRDLASPRARVVRDGEASRIAGRDVVRGDIVLLEEGDRVPADAAVLSCNDLNADESLLTGESVPVRKRPLAATDGAMAAPGGDELPWVFSGTLVTQGSATVEVVATGMRTAIGQIGAALQGAVEEPSPLQREIRYLVLRFAALGGALCVLVVVLQGLIRHEWFEGLLAGIALAMSNLPEEMPVVATVFLALGAHRIARRGVLTRRGGAIETLGTTTILCVDKTGTLTENRMSVRRLWAGGTSFEVAAEQPLPAAFHELVLHAVLASEADPFDPMEKAFLELGRRTLPDRLATFDSWSIVREYPLAPALLAHSHLWRTERSGRFALTMKGAPEVVAGLCDLPADAMAAVAAQIDAMAADGLRVLGVARASPAPRADGAWPDSQAEFDLEFLGLVALADPVRATVPAAIRECRGAGVRIVMITGDYPRTARAIAAQCGLARGDRVLTGAELASLDEAALAAHIETTDIFARVAPAQKLRIVNAFKAAGAVVAMTGDGVNDAPALKAAHIGIAMGKRGTDVAREAASLVLLEDDFASIVHAIRLGRRIFDNIRKAMQYIIAVHVPTAGIVLLSLLSGGPLVLYPLHVVFLEFVIDPACSIVFEGEPSESDNMRRPPRGRTDSLLGGALIATSLLQGAAMFASVGLLYVLLLAQGADAERMRTMTFVAIVCGNIGLIATNRGRQQSLRYLLHTPNPAFWWLVGAAASALLLVVNLPALASLFRLTSLGAADWLLSIAAATTGLTVIALVKASARRAGAPKIVRAGAIDASGRIDRCRGDSP